MLHLVENRYETADCPRRSSAHAADELVGATGLAGRTVIRTYPVVTQRSLLDSP